MTPYGGDVPMTFPSEAPDLTHILMPNMSYVCGGNIVTSGGHFVMTLDPEARKRVDCPGCRATNLWAVQDEFKRQQGRA